MNILKIYQTYDKIKLIIKLMSNNNYITLVKY